MITDTGGPAFPCDRILQEGKVICSDGMTLRDYFAAKAMQAFLTRETKFSENLMMYAGAAYDVADAMMKAREP